jgi:osmotically inducible protein OsmC
MIIRKSSAVWSKSIKEGNGQIEIGGSKIKMDYSFASRFENGKGTNPEELIAAAHAGCFSMAFSMILGNAGFVPETITTTAQVGIDKEGDGFKIKTIKLVTEAKVPGITNDDFQKLALAAKNGCPVSVALSAVPSIELEAKLHNSAGLGA